MSNTDRKILENSPDATRIQEIVRQLETEFLMPQCRRQKLTQELSELQRRQQRAQDFLEKKKKE